MAISEINDKSLAASAVNLASSTVTGILPTGNVNLTSISGSNLLKNGSNVVWQRGTSWSSGVNRYVHDRWYQWGYGGVVTQQTGINSIGYSARLQHNDGTANGFSSWSQSLETSDTVYARGNKLTFSVYLKKGSAFTGTLDLQIVERTDAEGSINTGTRNVIISADQSGTLSTSWQKFTVTTGSNVSTSALSIGVNITHSGTTGTDANNYFEFTQAQLEVGAEATAFQYRSYAEELNLCKRYFSQLGGQTPYQNIILAMWISGDTAVAPYYHRPSMRAACTITKLQNWGTLGIGVASQNVSADQNGPNSVQFGFSGGSGGTSGYSILLRGANNSGVYITFDAEL